MHVIYVRAAHRVVILAGAEAPALPKGNNGLTVRVWAL
jgi:hypothetical protein